MIIISLLFSGLFWTFSVGTFLAVFLIQAYLFGEQDLKKKYNAKWAVVTGASSGIGLSLTKKLAKQGINVLMVALDDKVFDDAHKSVAAQFPQVKFQKVGVDLSRDGYLEPIVKALDALGEDEQPNLLFNNAGFIATGHFADSKLERQLGNLECNAVSAVKITHVFANRLLDSERRGAICFTSSPAGLFACPSSAMYGATKAFLTEFAVSIAPELRLGGVDVLVVHPSPVATSFYKADKIGLPTFKLFEKTATGPDLIASCFFKSVGRAVIHEQGYFSVCVRLLLKVLDISFFNNIINYSAHLSADVKNSKVPRGKGKKKLS